jgi:hypothetical protein
MGFPRALDIRSFSIGVIYKKKHAFYYWHWDLRNKET